MRPIAVWHVEAVYWSNLPTVKTLQGLHWQSVKNSKPIRWFWYSFVGMFFYEFFPAYIFPWLNSVSIPCLASMNATGNTASILTTVFGGSLNNEGLGLFSISLDWQYVRISRQYAMKMMLTGLTDHILPNVSASRSAGPCGTWTSCLLCGHVGYLLWERMECTVTTIHVDQTSIS